MTDEEWKKYVKVKLDRLDNLLTGKDKPAEGVLFKIEEHERFIKFMRRFGWLVITLITGASSTFFTGIVIYFLRSGG